MITTYIVVSDGESNSYGGGEGDVVAVVRATSRTAALESALAAGVSVYRGQYLVSHTWRELASWQRRDAEELSCFIPCRCGRTIEAWRAAISAGCCTHTAASIDGEQGGGEQ